MCLIFVLIYPKATLIISNSKNSEILILFSLIFHDLSDQNAQNKFAGPEKKNKINIKIEHF